MSSSSSRKFFKPRSDQITDIMSLPTNREAMKNELRKRLIFGDVEKGSIPESSPPITFCRINYFIKNTDNTEGSLIVQTDRCFCFGINENRNPTDKRILNGYSASLSLYNKDGATPYQMQFVQFIEVLSDITKEYLLLDKTKESTELWELQEHHLEKINPLFYKKDKGKIIKDASPTLYPKLIWYKAGIDKKGKAREDTMKTVFYLEGEVDEKGEPLTVNPLEFLEKRHYHTAALRFDGIFLNSKNKNMQVHIHEAEVKEVDNGSKRLLKISTPHMPSVIFDGSNPLLDSTSNELSNSIASLAIDNSNVSHTDTGKIVMNHDNKLQLSDNEEEEEEEKPKPKPKKIKTKIKATKE